MVWGLYDHNNTELPPRVFTNGRNQEDIIDEIIESFDDHNIVLLKGGVGSGKSIIGATVAGAIGRGIINVPVKALQDQYKSDYEGRLFIRITDKNLRIRVLKGRSNFKCKKIIGFDVTCASSSLRCTMPLPKDVPRWEVAKKCRFWSPIYSRKIKALEEDSEIYEYDSHGGKQFYYKRTSGCGYYDQNEYYLNTDVLIFNNSKWYWDTVTNRKPIVDVEIFDEADFFLDGLSLRTNISTRRLNILLGESSEIQSDLTKEGKFDASKELEIAGQEVRDEFLEFIKEKEQNKPLLFNERTEVFLKDLLDFTKMLDTENSKNLTMQIHKVLEYSESASYFVRKETIVFFVPEPSLVLKNLFEKSASKILLMSATLQSQEVLKSVFGIDDFAYVEGETKMPGKLYVKKTGTENPINWKRWQEEEFRTNYWKTLEGIMLRAKRPTLVQVHSKNYLPNGNEFRNVITQEEFRNLNQEDEITSFKKKKREVIFSTKTDRGIDLPDGVCRSIVILKYPFPAAFPPVT